MSTVDQSLLIANSNYHVGQQVAVYVAQEQGYFREEGLEQFEYDGRGLIPATIEKHGLGPAIVEHGVDIATAVDVSAAIYQRSLGADIYIVGGWRYDPDLKWYGQKGISDIRQLKGKRLGIREREGLVYGFMANLLLQAGIDPEKEVTWVYDPVFGYGNDPKHVDMLRDGAVGCHAVVSTVFQTTRSRRISYRDGPARGISAQAWKSDRCHEENHRVPRR